MVDAIRLQLPHSDLRDRWSGLPHEEAKVAAGDSGGRSHRATQRPIKYAVVVKEVSSLKI